MAIDFDSFLDGLTVYGCGKKGNALLIVMRRYVKSVKDHMELPLDAPLNSVRPPLPVGEAMLMLVQIAGNIRELRGNLHRPASSSSGSRALEFLLFFKK